MASHHIADHGRRDFMRMAGSLVGLALAARPHVAAAQTTGSPLKIGMVGAGREGSALGRLFVKAGHPVMFSSRNPEGLKDLVAGLGPLAQAGMVEQAIAFGDVVTIAGRGALLLAFLRMRVRMRVFQGGLAQEDRWSGCGSSAWPASGWAWSPRLVPAATPPPPGLMSPLRPWRLSWRSREPRCRGVGSPGVRRAGGGVDRCGPLPRPLGDRRVERWHRIVGSPSPTQARAERATQERGKRC